MAEYIVNTDAEESRYKAMGADYSAYFENKAETLFGNPVKERIVRCKDCKHATRDCLTASLGCRHFAWDNGVTYRQMPVKPDGFCAWGEEKK